MHEVRAQQAKTETSTAGRQGTLRPGTKHAGCGQPKAAAGVWNHLDGCLEPNCFGKSGLELVHQHKQHVKQEWVMKWN
jgi:hypothetical protein